MQRRATTPLGLTIRGSFSQGWRYASPYRCSKVIHRRLRGDAPPSPQPTVNNFARRVRDFCEQHYRARKGAVTLRWMTNKQPVSLDESAQSFAPAQRLDSLTNTQMPTVGCVAIRPSP